VAFLSKHLFVVLTLFVLVQMLSGVVLADDPISAQWGVSGATSYVGVYGDFERENGLNVSLTSTVLNSDTVDLSVMITVVDTDGLLSKVNDSYLVSDYLNEPVSVPIGTSLLFNWNFYLPPGISMEEINTRHTTRLSVMAHPSGGGYYLPVRIDFEMSGCTNSSATNYDPLATIDDGTCEYPVPGCTDPGATNYDPDATVDDGSCEYPVLGCTDPAAFNYDELAGVDDGSCYYAPGCTDSEAFNYDPDADFDDGSCVEVILGCTDPGATNYNPSANTDHGGCIYSGCTDPLATNYDSNATTDDGSCTYTSTPPSSGGGGGGGGGSFVDESREAIVVEDDVVVESESFFDDLADLVNSKNIVLVLVGFLIIYFLFKSYSNLPKKKKSKMMNIKRWF
jgi:hypothetical protein